MPIKLLLLPCASQQVAMGGKLSNNGGGVAMEEVAKHTSKDDAWLVLFGEAIDVTRFIPRHPGGESLIEKYLGRDCTDDWQRIHKPEHLSAHWGHLTRMGKIQGNAGIMSWLWGRIKASPTDAAKDSSSSAKPKNSQQNPQEDEGEEEEESEEEEVEGMKWNAEHEAELPPGGLFDAQELSRWDGIELPMCIGICGKVVDVSSSSNFVPGFGYGKLWAGKDTTWAMANVSLKGEDAGRFDFTVDDLTEDHFNALAGWHKHFLAKYRTVGSLKEWRGVDFSRVEKMASEMEAAGMTAS